MKVTTQWDRFHQFSTFKCHLSKISLLQNHIITVLSFFFFPFNLCSPKFINFRQTMYILIYFSKQVFYELKNPSKFNFQDDGEIVNAMQCTIVNYHQSVGTFIVLQFFSKTKQDPSKSTILQQVPSQNLHFQRLSFMFCS